MSMILVVNEKQVRWTRVPNYTVQMSLTKPTTASIAFAFVS